MLSQLFVFTIFTLAIGQEVACDGCSDALKNLLNANMKDNLENGCEADWKYFNRPSGGWCIKVFAGVKTFDGASKACQAVNSRLSGLQNAEEIAFIQRATLSSISQSSSSVFIGTRRTKKCLNQTLTAECTPKTSFEWTDGSATGVEGFVFQKGFPQNWKLEENCAVLLASRTPSVLHNNSPFYAGQMDDVACDLPAVSTGPRAALAYVCGKKASK